MFSAKHDWVNLFTKMEYKVAHNLTPQEQQLKSVSMILKLTILFEECGWSVCFWFR